MTGFVLWSVSGASPTTVVLAWLGCAPRCDSGVGDGPVGYLPALVPAAAPYVRGFAVHAPLAG
jgi:hypothetical protein